MKINRFEFDEKPESGHFKRVETQKGLVKIGVSPYAETQKLEAVNETPVDEGPRGRINSGQD